MSSPFDQDNDSGIPPIDFRASLNDEQFAAVTAPAGPILVLAGAGSGKTRTLTYRVAYLLSQGVPPGEILLLTFTNKAAKEMLHRVQELTGVAPGRYAIALLDDANRNGKADMALFLPREGFGFSRNAAARFGPPKFAAAAFDVGTDEVSIPIRMRYMF